MKRLAIVFGVLCIGIFTMFIENDKKKRKSIYSKNDKDVEFTGPHGEKILVGSSGGSYYLRGDRKVYVKKK
ncbi:MAG: hypothetical protein ABI691_07515 [Ginsengibacter sp.]